MKRKKPPLRKLEPGENEALVLALLCFSANVTAAQFDRMSHAAREDVRATLGLSSDEFQAACEYLAVYQGAYRHALKALHEGETPLVIDEPAAPRLQ